MVFFFGKFELAGNILHPKSLPLVKTPNKSLGIDQHFRLKKKFSSKHCKLELPMANYYDFLKAKHLGVLTLKVLYLQSSLQYNKIP